MQVLSGLTKSVEFSFAKRNLLFQLTKDPVLCMNVYNELRDSRITLFTSSGLSVLEL